MENKLICVFVIVLLATLIITRFVSSNFHDSQGYSKISSENHEKIRTPSAYIRKTTGFDFHHIYAGFIILIIVLPLIFLGISNIFSIAGLAIGLSLVFDQLIPWMNFGNYFSREMIIISVLFHFIIIEVFLILNFFEFCY